MLTEYFKSLTDPALISAYKSGYLESGIKVAAAAMNRGDSKAAKLELEHHVKWLEAAEDWLTLNADNIHASR